MIKGGGPINRPIPIHKLQAFNLFRENKNLVDAAIILNMEADDVLNLHPNYLRLLNKDSLMSICKEIDDEILC
jgi:hypothetical protein